MLLGQGVCLGLRGNIRTVTVHAATIAGKISHEKNVAASGDPGAITGRAGASRSPFSIVQ